MTFSTAQPIDSAASVHDVHKRRLTRMALATTIGTAIEAFDFLAGHSLRLAYARAVGHGTHVKIRMSTLRPTAASSHFSAGRPGWIVLEIED
jgi:hypothetical protein